MGPRFGMLLVLVIVLTVGVGVAAGHSQSSTVAAPQVALPATPLPVPGAGQIDIVLNPSPDIVGQYLPATYTVRAGGTITWRNTDATAHTVVADSGVFSSKALSKGQTFTWTARTPGRYPYGCFLHPNMRGEIVVQR